MASCSYSRNNRQGHHILQSVLIISFLNWWKHRLEFIVLTLMLNQFSWYLFFLDSTQLSSIQFKSITSLHFTSLQIFWIKLNTTQKNQKNPLILSKQVLGNSGDEKLPLNNEIASASHIYGGEEKRGGKRTVRNIMGEKDNSNKQTLYSFLEQCLKGVWEMTVFEGRCVRVCVVFCGILLHILMPSY